MTTFAVNRHHQNMASLKNIAQRAGVSISTASRVLNGAHTSLPISVNTRDNVLAAAAALNYVPDAAARALRRGSTHTLAVLGQDPNSFAGHGHFTSLLNHALLRAGVDVQYHLLLLTGSESDSGPYKLLADLGMADGILILNRDINANPYLDRLDVFPKPIVYVFDYPESGNWSSVSALDDEGGQLAVKHLLDIGHQRIGFVDGPYFKQIFNRRRDGWRRQLQSTGNTPEADWEVSIQDASADWLHSQQLTAVITANDSIARELTEKCRKAGVRIPEDLSLVSFSQEADEQPPPAGLTCVSQPIDQVVRDAVRQLVAQIENQAPTKRIRHHYRLIEQFSTQPIYTNKS